MKRIIAWLPDRADGRLKAVAWAYLAGQIVLVGTGGLVRLTSSGLGCPTWPSCTADSIVNTPEMGIHGLIEFGNRALGVLLGLVAVLAFLAVVRLRKERRDLFWLTLLAGLGIPAQAVIGGISVLSGLNPHVVGLHFIVSAALVALCTAFLVRAHAAPGPRVRAVPDWLARIAHLTSALIAITILIGILTTGSGPHAGDADAPRNGLNPEILQHLHSYPAYASFALTLALVVGAWRARAAGDIGASRICDAAVLLLAIEVAQIAVGVVQSNTGLPAILVGVHMVLAATMAAAMTAVLLSLKAPAAHAPDAESIQPPLSSPLSTPASARSPS